MSGLDAAHRLQRRIQTARTEPQNAGLQFYQKTLSQAWGSRCQFLPSDSVYATHLFKTCDPARATALTMARLMGEGDAAGLATPYVVGVDMIRYIDLPETCEGWILK